MTSRSWVLAVMLLLLWVSAPVGAWASNGADNQETQPQVEVSEELRAMEQRLSSHIDAQLVEHRQYLQDLDERFYDRISFWIPIASLGIGAIFALFLWYVGRTQKEAFDNASRIAVNRASSLASRKVEEIIIPEEVLRRAEQAIGSTWEQVSAMQATLVDEVRGELEATRDSIVHDKDSMILQAVEGALNDEFKDQVDILGRLKSLEDSIEHLDERLAKLMNTMKKPLGTRRDSSSRASAAAEAGLGAPFPSSLVGEITEQFRRAREIRVMERRIAELQGGEQRRGKPGEAQEEPTDEQG